MDAKIEHNPEATGRGRKNGAPADKSSDESRGPGFVYGDADVAENEIAEFYSYTEGPEFLSNLECYRRETILRSNNVDRATLTSAAEEEKSLVMKMLEQLEVTDGDLRMRAARCLLYVAQGRWAEVHSGEQRRKLSSSNAMMLYRMDAFGAFVQLLNYEIDNSACDERKLLEIGHSMDTSKNFRVVLSVLYTMVEVVREEQTREVSGYGSEVDDFVWEMSDDTGKNFKSNRVHFKICCTLFKFPTVPLLLIHE